MKKKLKRKIWTTSTALFLIYITILILNPTIWISILPIIIPTGMITVGLPTYNIIKNTRDYLEQKNKEQKISTKKLNIETNQNMEIEKKIITNDIEREKFNHIELETQYEQNINQEEKPKVKTKGTIH